MIDADGFRPNVGIIVLHPTEAGQVLLAKRIGQQAWQFPQGGIKRGESPEDACYRELEEELGLKPKHVELLGATEGWLSYLLPKHLVRRGNKPLCIGQKQRWFLLKLTAGDDRVRLDANATPEFDAWRWVDYWSPVAQVIYFKRAVYQQALTTLAAQAGVTTAPPSAFQDAAAP
ncbi:MAG: RNA pyrophosphohydrolase [Stagnimonas sp.]|nr:RNA pyrophosphohydrolase [Stagnimonas sp.]